MGFGLDIAVLLSSIKCVGLHVFLIFLMRYLFRSLWYCSVRSTELHTFFYHITSRNDGTKHKQVMFCACFMIAQGRRKATTQQRNKLYKVLRKERKKEVRSDGRRASKKRTDEEKVVHINMCFICTIEGQLMQ